MPNRYHERAWARMKIKKTIRKSISGIAPAFTIADVLVAVLVLATIGSAFYTALSCGFTMVLSSRDDLRATQILMQKSEAIRLLTWGQLTNFSFREVYDPFGVTNNSAGTVYTGTVVTNAASGIPNTASYATNMRLVTITLAWTNSTGTPLRHTRQLQTEVARYGVQNYIWGAGQ